MLLHSPIADSALLHYAQGEILAPTGAGQSLMAVHAASSQMLKAQSGAQFLAKHRTWSGLGIGESAKPAARATPGSSGRAAQYEHERGVAGMTSGDT